MLRVAIVTCFLFCLPSLAKPQNASTPSTPRLELSSGYSHLWTDSRPPAFFGDFIDQRLHGWNASACGNVNGWLGVVADYSHYYGSTVDTFVPFRMPEFGKDKLFIDSFMVGPRASIRRHKRVTPYAQALFGVVRAKAHIRGIDTRGVFIDKGFGLSVGGGVDININEWVGVRPIQGEYLQGRVLNNEIFSEPLIRHNVRITGGVVFRFGRR